MYHTGATLATTKRVLQQITHDHRTLALILFVPSILIALLRWVYDDAPAVFTAIAPALLGIFPFIIMFVVTSIATLRERTGGTLERLMASPIGKFDFIAGYAIAFGLLAIAQASIASLVTLYALDLQIQGGEGWLILVALLDALLGTALGLLASAFAKTEFQAVQFMPAFIFPQLLLCGLLIPVAQMPGILEAAAYMLPVTYAVDALSLVATEAELGSQFVRDITVIAGFVIAALVISSATLRRQTK